MNEEDKSAELINKLKKFEEEFGDELDACHPDAFDVIYALIKNPRQSLDDLKSQLFEFNEEYMEDLEGCNEEACSTLNGILKSISI